MSVFTGDNSLVHCKMASLTPSSTNISLTQAVAFTRKKSNILSRRSILRNVNKHTLPLSTSIRLFPQFHIGCVLRPKQRTLAVYASGTDVAVEEADVSSETSGESSAVPETSPVKSQRSRPARKSDMPPVKNEELIAGATFTGKVRSIQPFGAFVDFGAFTDGLIHVSQLSDSYVKDVASVVSVGQEVTVRLVEANLETGRISLSMRADDSSRAQQQRESPGGGDKSRPPRRTGQNSDQRREDPKKFSKFVKDQDLEGTVKNLTRSGAFISLPEDEEGFLPQSEENDGGFGTIMGVTSLEIGQEVSVRVLRISRGKVTLTMKKDEDVKEVDSKLQGKMHTATNPFVLAFRSNEAITSFLDERESEKQQVEEAEEIAKGTDDVTDKETPNTADDIKAEVEEKSEETDSSSATGDNEVTAAIDPEETEEIAKDTDAVADEETPNTADDIKAEVEEKSEEIDSSSATEDNEVTAAIDPEEIAKDADDGSSHTEDQVTDELSQTETKEDNDGEVSGEESVVSSQIVEEAKESMVDDETIKDELADSEQQLSGELTNQTTPDVNDEETPNAADDIKAEVEEKSEETDSSSVTQDNEVTAAIDPVGSDSSSAETESGDLEAKPAESPITISDNLGADIAVNGVENQASGDSQPNGDASSSSEQSSNDSPKEAVVKATISPALVKQLREETGAGMMDCKRALSEAGGDIEKAYEYLRKKGLASADKKSSRATAEGRIGSYIHDSRIGVLIEVNCETDFVARGDIFKELVEDLAMQVAACPQVQYLSPEDVSQEFVDKEKEIEMQKEDLLSKPEQIRSKIVEGRIKKRLDELALLEQPFIKDDKVAVKDWVKQTIATIGENIKVKRFIRYNLGEGLEKKSQDFAAEVAAQTAAKPVSTSAKPEPAAAETKETVQEPPKTAVSAALVKQLREETGAGMMDCKKALSETGGDLEKAHEYLRKKGLAAADKKSSRIAAEGRIGSYIHDSRIGVLIEVNCETDFVGRSENFKELVEDLAMQVAACPQVQYVSVEDVPESIVAKEKELEMQREDLQSKPESIREKIVDGRIAKRLGELALLEQAYIKNDTILVKDLVKQTVATLGENIKVRRFARFTLGEMRDAVVEEQA
ncbi:polyprotein of EF-Ts, chloroplastic [Salvia hispanica]|uniref:polyprotein of EF-Ts, chloroplastic n=1 Tax=Salvia hispanica TaxID=49212 RepID=UPI0020098AA4|nr:polyprotein of EF-Ts, chloroplastic [Salvia hispanica]